MSDKQPKLWETDEWKATRKRLLKSFCEWCNAEHKPLVLTHTKPFPKALSVSRKIRASFLQEMIQNGTIEVFAPDQEVIKRFTIQVCPECSSRSLNLRKRKKPAYRCSRCNYEFAEPLNTVDGDNYEYKQLEYQYYNSQLEQFAADIDSLYQKEMDQLRVWYLSGEDTITLCNSCSFALKKGKILCRSCQDHYHHPRYNRCYQCNSQPCDKCGKNLVSPGEKTCRECLEEKQICSICGKPFAGDLLICDSCILEGHWVE